MDPVIGSALITAGTSVVGGLMQSKAQAEEARRQRMLEAMMSQMQMEQQARTQQAQSAQNVLGQMQQGYTQAFGIGG